jgi:hypothetical protein
MAYFRNAVFVPQAIEAMREITEFERFIATLSDGEVRSQAPKKLRLLRQCLKARGSPQFGVRAGEVYYRPDLDWSR